MFLQQRRAHYQIQTHHLALTNISSEPVDTHLIVCFMTMTAGVTVMDAEGNTRTTPVTGVPYLRVFIPEGTIEPGEVMDVSVRLSAAATTNVSYTIDLLSGQGKP